LSHLFISHSTRDKAQALKVLDHLAACGYRMFLDSEPEFGIDAGQEWEKELYRNLNLASAVLVLCSDNLLTSKWCFFEIASARALGKLIFPVIVSPCEVLGLLKDRQIVNFAAEGELALERLLAGLRAAGLDPNDSLAWDPRRPPYPGFNYFTEEDAGVFFGRDDEVRQVLEGLATMQRRGVPRLGLVLGSSGSGKSSLIRAGVLPRLRKDPARWVIVPAFRPGPEPIGELAKYLTGAFPAGPGRPDWEDLRDRLLAAAAADHPQSPDPLAKLATDLAVALDHREAVVLLTVDQAEEALTDGSGWSSRFLRLIRRGAEAPGSPLFVLLTLRSDYFGAFQNHPALNGLKYTNLPLGPMAVESFSRVIAGPARRAGIEVSDGLVAEMVADTRTNDALPLLAFALRAMYDRTTNPRLFTHVLYREKLDGIQGVVAVVVGQIKDEVSLAPGSSAEADFRRAFLKLVRLDPDGNYVRKPTHWDVLPEAARPILQKMIDARLLASKGEGSRRTVEVVHESLFRVWDDLAGWLAEKRELLLWRQNIQDELASWKASGEAPDYLLSGGRVAEAHRTLSADREEFGPDEIRFLEASIAEEERRTRERQRLYRRVRLAAIVATVLAVLASIAGGVVYNQRNTALAQGEQIKKQAGELKEQYRKLDDESKRADRLRKEAERQSRLATVQRLVAQSEGALELYPQRSLLLAVQAFQAASLDNQPRDPAAEQAGEQVLREMLSRVGGRGLHGHDGSVMLLAISPDSRWLVTTAESTKTATLWNLASHDPAASPRILRGHEEVVDAATISPDSHWLVTRGLNEKTIRLWDLTAQDPAAAPVVLDGHDVDFSPDHRWLVSHSFNEQVLRVWDLTAAGPTVAPRVLHGVVSAEISGDSHWLVMVATAVGKTTLRLWDLTARDPSASPRVLNGPEGSFSLVLISPNSRWLVTGGGLRRTARLWDLTAQDPAVTSVVFGDKHVIDAMAFSDDSRWLVTNSHVAGDAELWDLTAQDLAAPPQSLRGKALPIPGARSGLPFDKVHISPDSRWLVISVLDGTAWSWSLIAADPAATCQILGGSARTTSVRDYFSTDVTFSRDGHWMVTKSRLEGTARLWDLVAEDPFGTFKVLSGPGYSYSAGSITPNSRWLVTTAGSNTAQLWDLAAQDPTYAPLTLRGHDGKITGTTISRDGHWLVTASADTTARRWDLTAPDPGATPRVLRGHKGQFEYVETSRTGRWLVANALYDETARLWDLTSLDPAASPIRLPGHEKPLAISRDGDRLVTASANGNARLWDLTAPSPSTTARDLRGYFVSQRAAFSPDGRWLVAINVRDKAVRLWDPAAPDRADMPIALDGHGGGISRVAISPNSRWLVTGGSNDNAARLWDLAAPHPAHAPIVLPDHKDVVSSVVFSPDSRWLVTYSGSAKEPARLWDLTARNPAASLRIVPMLGRFEISRDSRWLIPRGKAPGQLWNMTLRDPAASPIALRGYESGIYGVSISPNSRRLVTIGTWSSSDSMPDRIVRIWDLMAHDPAAAPVVLPDHEGSLGAGEFSPDSRWLLIRGKSSKSEWLWDLTAADPAAAPVVLRGHEDVITHQAFSPDCRWLVTLSRDLTTRMWDLTAPDPAATPRVLPGVHQSPITTFFISPDSRWLVTISRDGARLDHLQSSHLVELARLTAGRNLTRAEWDQYFPGQRYCKTFPELPEPQQPLAGP
jgi:WD40 repeat protein